MEMMIFLGILIVGYIWIWKKARWSGYRTSRARGRKFESGVARTPAPRMTAKIH